MFGPRQGAIQTETSGRPDLRWGVVHRLVCAPCRHEAVAALHVLNQVVEGSAEWYELDYAVEELRASAEVLKAIGDPEIDAGVRHLINALGERGTHGLRDLL